jgi:SHS2 domain-containing protein
VSDLFADAAAALTATLVDPSTVMGRAREWVALSAPSLELLLVDWLNDLVFRFDVDEFVTARVTPRIERQQDEWKLEPSGGTWNWPATALLLVKGVIYHQLRSSRLTGIRDVGVSTSDAGLRPAACGAGLARAGAIR